MKHDHRMQSNSKIHKYPTQNKEIPNLPQATTYKYRSSFLFRAIKEFSNLNSNLKTCNTLNMFSQQCERHHLYYINITLLSGVPHFQAYKNFQAYRQTLEPPNRIIPVDSPWWSNPVKFSGKMKIQPSKMAILKRDKTFNELFIKPIRGLEKISQS